MQVFNIIFNFSTIQRVDKCEKRKFARPVKNNNVKTLINQYGYDTIKILM